MIVNRSQLETVLRNVRGATFCSIVALTKCDVRSGSPLTGRDVRKLSRRNCVIGFGYESVVNRQREREEKDADFVAASRRWGARIAGTPLVAHNGKLYLEAKVERVCEYRYHVDGRIESTEIVEPNLRDGGRADRQELDRPVVLRDFGLESIVTLALNGALYEVREHRSTDRVSA